MLNFFLGDLVVVDFCTCLSKADFIALYEEI